MPSAAGKTQHRTLADVRSWHDRLRVPDPVTFALSRSWLNRPTLYPRQATLLKIVFLRDDLLTDYDHRVIAEWTAMWPAEESDRHFGIQPDIYDRIAILKERGAPWFRHVLLPVGRRGGKGHVAAIATSYVLWTLMSFGSPQERFGIDPDKQLHTLIYAIKKEQAKANLYGDIYSVITYAPCFAPWLARPLTDTLSVYAPGDAVRAAARSVQVGRDMATFQISPKEATETSGRGVAACVLGLDESAHMAGAGSTASARQIYDAAEPALGQLKQWAMAIQPSSTWAQDGLFYESYVNACETLPDGTPAYPDMLVLRLASWDIYQDWEFAHEISVFPPGFEGDLREYA
jgi:hypothetical protein